VSSRKATTSRQPASSTSLVCFSSDSPAADANDSLPRTPHVSINHGPIIQHSERVNDFPSHRYLRNHKSILKPLDDPLSTLCRRLLHRFRGDISQDSGWTYAGAILHDIARSACRLWVKVRKTDGAGALPVNLQQRKWLPTGRPGRSIPAVDIPPCVPIRRSPILVRWEREAWRSSAQGTVLQAPSACRGEGG
jgi:hypothetical protein